jgi:hypothetical protein
MLVNNEEIPILVIYYIKSRIIHQKEFGSFSKFGELIEYFNENIKSNFIKLKKKYLLNDKEIKYDDLLIDLIQVYDKSKKIISANFSLELEEIYNIWDEENPSYKKILQPKLTPNFGIYIFYPEFGSLSLEEYPENIIKKYHLYKINNLSAFCNSYDSLFISGGIYNQEEIKDFWIINNKNLSIKKIKMPFTKSNHSMIYFEFNEYKYIFFVGGNDLNTFYYDISTKKFQLWNNINSLCFHPNLIQYQNYLYCFNTKKGINKIIFLEKTKIDNSERTWENVEINFEKNIKEKFLNNNFCVSKCAGKKIIFISENINGMNEGFVLLYDIDKNLIENNKICENKYINSGRDKNFYKINNSHSIILPDYSNIKNINTNYEIGILNKIKYTFRKIRLNPCNISNINKSVFKRIQENEGNIGKIIVKFKTEESNKNSENINDIYNQDSEPLIDEPNNIFSENNLPLMINSNHLNLSENITKNIQQEKSNIIQNKNEEKEKKNEDYIAYNSKEVDNDEQNLQEENAVDDIQEDEIFNEENDINGNKLFEKLKAEYEEEDEEYERDRFELTIKQPLGEDIMQVDNYPIFMYDKNNFCDYKI